MSFFKSITTKPWERKGVLGGLEPEGAFESANEKVALSIFLIVASVVFFSLYRRLYSENGAPRLASLV
jgi:hypothetical protein